MLIQEGKSEAELAGDELCGKVKAWIQTQGFPLEMQVADVFLKAGFRVVQADYYTDPDTQTSREIDVVASAQTDCGKYVIRLNVVAECKVSKDKPWVLLTSPQARLSPLAQVAQQAANRTGEKLLMRAAEIENYQQLPLFRSPDRPAYGVLQAFNSGNDTAYIASMSVAKATAALVTERDTQGELIFAEIVIPVVIVDGRLFDCHLDSSGNLLTEEVEEGLLVWRNSVVGQPHTMIRFISLPFLGRFVERVKQAAELILGSEEAEMARLLS